MQKSYQSLWSQNRPLWTKPFFRKRTHNRASGTERQRKEHIDETDQRPFEPHGWGDPHRRFSARHRDKKIVSYLPERSYLNRSIRVAQAIEFFSDFYEDFDRGRAYDMLARLHIERNERLSTMSKGTREKVQLILVMSRRSRLYCLDEPIAGVDPAARDFILSTIINNYDENATILISTHLISDIENILDEVLFLEYGQLRMHSSVDDIRYNQGKSIDAMFREVFKC